MTPGGNVAAGDLLAAALSKYTNAPVRAFGEHVQADWADRQEMIGALTAAGLDWESRSMVRARVGDAWLTLAPSADVVGRLVSQFIVDEDVRDPVTPRLGLIMWDILAVDAITAVAAVVNDRPFGQAPAVGPVAETLAALLVDDASELGLPVGPVFPDADLGVRQATHSLMRVLREIPELLAVAKGLQVPGPRVVVAQPAAPGSAERRRR